MQTGVGKTTSSNNLLRSPSSQSVGETEGESLLSSYSREDSFIASSLKLESRGREVREPFVGPSDGVGTPDRAKGTSNVVPNEGKEGMLRVGATPEAVRGSLATKPPTVVRRGRQGVMPLLFEFVVVTTVENLHTYLWILKDLAWAQAWYLPGWVCGSNAVLLSFLVCMGSLMHRELTDLWHNLAQLLWLSANFIWMAGDLHDAEFPDEPPTAIRGAQICALIMIVALCWLSVYFTFLHPLQILEEKRDGTTRLAVESSYLAKMLCFSNWRDYERLHMFFWLMKDFGWNTGNIFWWYIGFIPTAAMALDFIASSARVEGLMTVECVHYMALFIWGIGNATWAYAELHYGLKDPAHPLFDSILQTRATYRWASAWVILSAFLPITIFYCALARQTMAGKLPSFLTARRKPGGIGLIFSAWGRISGSGSNYVRPKQSADDDLGVEEYTDEEEVSPLSPKGSGMGASNSPKLSSWSSRLAALENG